jgi:hypothetical protein
MAFTLPWASVLAGAAVLIVGAVLWLFLPAGRRRRRIS